jgi:hypothetical protein
MGVSVQPNSASQAMLDEVGRRTGRLESKWPGRFSRPILVFRVAGAERAWQSIGSAAYLLPNIASTSSTPTPGRSPNSSCTSGRKGATLFPSS